MKKYADTVSAQDKKQILDLYYGRGAKEKREALNRWQIAKRMDNRYTPAQILSVILDDIEKEKQNEQE